MTELSRFVRGFQKALRLEMDAMRQQLGSFEVPLRHGRALPPPPGSPEDLFHYTFALAVANEKLVAPMECTLRQEKSEYLVKVLTATSQTVELACGDRLSLDGPGPVLVIYPWFLYEKLLVALGDLNETYHLDNALRLFGCQPPQKRTARPALEHRDLNKSQRRAIALCYQTNPAFVWGPPGTGKTHTLGAILADMLNQGKRILVSSTTNAAIDQALDKVAAHPTGKAHLQAHQIVRLGQSTTPTSGANLADVAAAYSRGHRQRIDEIEQRLEALDRAASASAAAESLIADSLAHTQLLLFGQATAPAELTPLLQRVFSPKHATKLAARSPQDLAPLVATRARRLNRLIALYRQRRRALAATVGQSEQQAFADARLIFATLANVYLHPLMQGARFDVVIIEEASMAVLPTLFYAACLAAEQVVVVGDPRQLPPIVQSADPYVLRAMGRSIFSISAPDPHRATHIALLDTQYRMHPVIGDLVSELFYRGALISPPASTEHLDLLARAPYPDRPIALLDISGTTRCARSGRHSRRNEGSARLAVNIATTASSAGYPSIGVITPYVEQARLIWEQLALESVECSTVHRFQGREKDLIILDLVDAAPLPPGRLLADPSRESPAANLLNVSLSRAKAKLIIIADLDYFFNGLTTGPLRHLLERAKAMGAVLPVGGEAT